MVIIVLDLSAVEVRSSICIPQEGRRKEKVYASSAGSAPARIMMACFKFALRQRKD
jgi:hypothetical protein